MPPGQGDATGEVLLIEPMGREQIVDVRLGERLLQVLVPLRSAGATGDRVGVRFDRDQLHLFDRDDGDRLG